MSISTTARNEQIVALVNAGAPRTRIATAFDISRQRVDQIVKEATETPEPDTKESLLAEFGVTTTITEKPKARKASKPKKWNYYAQGENKATMRNALRERLGAPKGTPWRVLTETADARSVSYADITAPFGG